MNTTVHGYDVTYRKHNKRLVVISEDPTGGTFDTGNSISLDATDIANLYEEFKRMGMYNN